MALTPGQFYTLNAMVLITMSDNLARIYQLQAALQKALHVADARERETRFLRRLLWSLVAGITVISVLVVIFLRS